MRFCIALASRAASGVFNAPHAAMFAVVRDTYINWGIAMNKHQVRGAANETAGKVQKHVGKATANGTQQVKGAVREAAGKVEKEIGNAKADHERRMDNDRRADRDIERHTR